MINKLIANLLKLCPALVTLLLHRDPRVFDAFCRWVEAHPFLYERSRLAAGCVLVLLNIRFLFFGIFFKRKPYLKGAESALSNQIPPDELVKKLSSADLVSFDIFDTLLFRCFDDPSAVFDIIGEKLQIAGFRTIRKKAENQLIEKSRTTNQQYNIEDIADLISKEIGISADQYVNLEIETEKECCYANPYMLKVFSSLLKQGKRIIVTSDMYLHEKTLREFLLKNGFSGFEKLYVSCDACARKFDGSIFRLFKEIYPGQRMIHVGDHPIADVSMARTAGLKAYLYENVNTSGKKYRPETITPLLQSFYSGLVNAHLHNGLQKFSVPYEYGFLYGGLFVYGFCHWIHDMAKMNGSEKIFFIARDGDILKKVYDMLYPDDIPSVYFLWSRVAAMKYISFNRLSLFFDLMIRKRLNDTVQYTISDVLESAGCSFLSSELPEGMSLDDVLTSQKADVLFRFLEMKQNEIFSVFQQDKTAVKKYMDECIGQSRKLMLVDIGWVGSCPLSVKKFISEEMKQKCEVSIAMAAYCRKGMEAPLLLSPKIQPYLFGESKNQNICREHEKEVINTLLFEMFTASQHPYLSGFTINDNGFVQPVYYPKLAGNDFYIDEIQHGILDFVKIFHLHTVQFPWLRNISGVDAYLPFSWIMKSKCFFRKFFADYLLESVPGIKQNGAELKHRI